jgi:hypothetical protein
LAMCVFGRVFASNPTIGVPFAASQRLQVCTLAA